MTKKKRREEKNETYQTEGFEIKFGYNEEGDAF